MKKVAIVVLNYLNYTDTIECVDSILLYKYDIEGVIIVDNGSSNESFEELCAKYNEKRNVYILRSEVNLGYAKGNNIGINYAQKVMGAEFVLVVNNDTVFKDPNYIDILLTNYKDGVGCIGSRILLEGGVDQGRYYEYISIRNTLIYLINAHSKKRGSSFDFLIDRDDSVELLHGAAIMLTPSFFRYYKGFYPKTFLYGEEAILYYMCECRGLKQVYVRDTCIFHKEDQSSIMSFNNDIAVINDYQYQSRKYILLWAIKNKACRVKNHYYVIT